jgi:retinol-binding protein 3
MKRFTILEKLLICIALLTGMTLQTNKVSAQSLDATDRTSAINGILRELNEGYIFPEVAKKMEQSIREKEAKGAYKNITDGLALAQQLTKDLQAICHDLHVNVNYSPAILPPQPKEFKPSPEQLEEMKRILTRENFGVAKVEVLKGNLGYIKFNLLAPPDLAADVYTATFNYVGNTDALIIDLRECGGSISPDAIPMLTSYLFENPVHLNDIYWRSEDKTRQFWSWAYVPGKRYFHKPVYVLTSRNTFSGAEELAYDLKNLKRATIIGDTTGGGANPGGSRRVDDHFSVWVPNGKVTNPVTKTNWEGVGVMPDIAVPATTALHVARMNALKQLTDANNAAATNNEMRVDEEWKRVVADELSNLEKSQPKTKMVTFTLKGYDKAKEVIVAGTFNYWNTRANKLTRKGNIWQTQVPMETGNHAYKFVVDGHWLSDPANPKYERDDVNANSMLTVE